MGIHHCAPGEVVNLLRLNEQLPNDATFAIVKTDRMEVIRMFLPKGKKIPGHSVSGAITVHCISGRLTFNVDNEPNELQAADWLFLSPNQEHSLHAFEDSVVLVTILLAILPA